jgi:hypothetical protein
MEKTLYCGRRREPGSDPGEGKEKREPRFVDQGSGRCDVLCRRAVLECSDKLRKDSRNAKMT